MSSHPPSSHPPRKQQCHYLVDVRSEVTDLTCGKPLARMQTVRRCYQASEPTSMFHDTLMRCPIWRFKCYQLIIHSSNIRKLGDASCRDLADTNSNDSDSPPAKHAAWTAIQPLMTCNRHSSSSCGLCLVHCRRDCCITCEQHPPVCEQGPANRQHECQ
jgi:hypothetical protein